MPKPKIGLEKYPEFKKAVNKIANDACKAINKEAKNITSEMPYKAQFILEEVIKILEERV